ncbi:hypothetical protein AB0L65_54585 [Nonomuraea sp. NPDC052116]|uniref:hypothetical protein n=1 Tax=Nonomuraea sp. NPDC052116 TaxID=3155665 RepID=UPI00341382A4
MITVPWRSAGLASRQAGAALHEGGRVEVVASPAADDILTGFAFLNWRGAVAAGPAVFTSLSSGSFIMK